MDKLIPSRVTTMLWLIVLPSILLIIIENEAYSNSSFSNPYGFVNSEVGFILVVLLFFTYVAAFVKYIPYHYRHYRDYFTKNYVVEAVKEYQFSKKLFYVAAAIVIFLFFFRLTGALFYFYEQLSAEQDPILFWIITFFLTIFTLATITLGTRFAWQYSKKDFGFFLARAYYMVSFQQESGIGKFKHLTLALDTYNKFLERNLKLKIKDIMRIYSIFISASIEQKIKIRDSIGSALEKDELELARQLAELSSLQDKEQFLIREPAILNQQFKDILTIIIPAIISIVGFIITIILPLIMRPLGSQSSP